MGRSVLAMVAGEAVWTVLWLGGTTLNMALFPEIAVKGERLEHTGILAGLVVFSVFVSVAAGWVTAAVKGRDPMATVWVFAGVQLAIGIAVEIGFWALMPAWYHIAFLAFLIPATVWGGRWRAGRA